MHGQEESWESVKRCSLGMVHRSTKGTMGVKSAGVVLAGKGAKGCAKDATCNGEYVKVQRVGMHVGSG